MQFKAFKEYLANHGIKMLFFMNRVLLKGEHNADELALEHYREQIKQSPQFEAWLISEWSKEDSESGQDVKFAIEERIAIKAAEGLQTDERSVILSMIT